MVAAACNFSGEKCLDDDLESTGKSQLIDGKTNESEVIVFTAPDGVEDVASVVKNHAIAMAGMNRKVLVIDAKSRDKQLTRKMKIEMAEGFSEWLQGDANLEEEIRKKMDGHFEIVPAGKKQLQVGLLTRKETETLVRNLGSQYDTVC